MVHLASSSYGKDLVRILRLSRDAATGQHSIAEYNIRCLLSGKRLLTSYTEGDNSLVVATDSVKNTLNILAKRLPAADVLCPERYALQAARHFLETYDHLDAVDVQIEMLKWSRIQVTQGSAPHKHSFVRDGDDKRVVQLKAVKQGGKAVVQELKGGLKDLLVLKTTASAFSGFYRDEYTTLKEVEDRIFSTAIDCSCGCSDSGFVRNADGICGKLTTTSLHTDTISLGTSPISSILSSSSCPKFCQIAEAVREHTMRIFAETHSASVQATLFDMCRHILQDAARCASVEDVEYALPNKHYIPIDLGFIGLQNTAEKDVEVFLPTAHPRSVSADARRMNLIFRSSYRLCAHDADA